MQGRHFILFFTMGVAIDSKEGPLCVFSPSMKCLLVLFFVFFGSASLPLLAQIPSNGFFSDPLSAEAKRLNSRFIFAHQHLQPFASLLDTLGQVRDTTTQSVCMGVYGAIAGGQESMSTQRGVGDGIVGLSIGLKGSKKVSAELGYSYIASALPTNVATLSSPYEVLWGVGKAKKEGDFYLAHLIYGNASVRLGRYFQLDCGRQKHHLGDGYRSLIIGQQAAPLPFFRVNAQVHKVRFFSEWMRATHSYEAALNRKPRHKYLAMHGLSMNLGKRFNFTAYEMVVWQDRDTLNQRGLDIHYLNPIVFYRPLEYAQGSADNVILAASMRYKATKKLSLYAQVVLDEFKLNQLRRELKWWANKYGGQLGVKWFDVLPGFDMLVEGNVVRPFTYTHGSPIQSWTHWSQPMAHPLGANFAEVLWRGKLEKNRWKLQLQALYGAYGRDEDTDADGEIDNLGGDISRSYRNPFRQYGNGLLQGSKTNLFYQHLDLAYVVDKYDAWEVFISQHYRLSHNSQEQREQLWILVGFRAVGLMSALRDI
jgi:hypothetical protein